jgi:PEP-CTERM motif
MLTRQQFLFSLAPVLLAASASADPIVYITSGAQTFGSIDVTTGVFQLLGQGPNASLGYFGLAAGPNGSLYTFLYNGDVDSINPATGVAADIGPSGLGDCTTLGVSPCGPNSANDIGGSAGNVYATDYQNNLYGLNPLTGAATLIGPTGIPAFVPGFNPDGTVTFYDEAIFGAPGGLYMTFDSFEFNLNTFTNGSVVVAPELYRINTSTGGATPLGPTDLGIGAVVGVNGTYYAFDDITNQIESLNLTNGSTTFVSNFDPAAGLVQGAVATPEPASIALLGTGLLALASSRVRKRYRRI